MNDIPIARKRVLGLIALAISSQLLCSCDEKDGNSCETDTLGEATCQDTSSETDTEEGTDTTERIDTASDSGQETPTDSDSDTGTESDTGPDTDTGTAADTDTDSDSETDPSVQKPQKPKSPPTLKSCTPNATLPIPSSVISVSSKDQSMFYDADFVLDAEGKIVGVNQEGSVLKKTLAGESLVFAEKATIRGRGIAYLSTGELIIADSGQGSLLKVSRSGRTEVLLNGLDYPNGIDVDLENNIYVTEALQGTIRMVDPRNGENTIIAKGIDAMPNGLAFSPDYKTLYCASRGTGAVYAIKKEVLGWSEPFVLAALPGAAGQCIEKAPGHVCTTSTLESGTCTLGFQGELSCQGNGACEELEQGASCESLSDSKPGVCVANDDGVLYCDIVLPCDDKNVGDTCEYEGDSYYDYEGDFFFDDYFDPFCVLLGDCSGSESSFNNGICDLGSNGFLFCRKAQICEGAEVGEDCFTLYGDNGTCQPADDPEKDSALYCIESSPCDGATEGDYCLTRGRTGVCKENASKDLDCVQLGPCDALETGDPCRSNGQNGICQLDRSGKIYCHLPSVCDEKAEGEMCFLESGYPGECRYGDMYADMDVDGDTDSDSDMDADMDIDGDADGDNPDVLQCRYTNNCEAGKEGDSCYGQFGIEGICVNYGYDMGGLEGPEFSVALECETAYACDGVNVGERCSELAGSEYICNDQLDGSISCQSNQGCEGLDIGDLCSTGNSQDDYYYDDDYYYYDDDYYGYGTIGRIVSVSSSSSNGTAAYGTCEENRQGDLYCRPYNPCEFTPVDSLCMTNRNSAGRCTKGENGLPFCRAVGPCDGKKAGASCTTERSKEGICEKAGGYPGIDWGYDENDEQDEYSNADADADADSDSDSDTDYDTDYEPVWPSYIEELYCRPISPCDNKEEGDVCTSESNLRGICTSASEDSSEEGPASSPIPFGDTDSYSDADSDSDGDSDGDADWDTDWYDDDYTLSTNGLYCRILSPCFEREPGDSCTAASFGLGVCVEGTEELTCVSFQSCISRQKGDSCRTYYGRQGVCAESQGGPLYCLASANNTTNSCSNSDVGDPCTNGESSPGFCASDENGELFCEIPATCEGAASNSACVDVLSGLPGTCALADLGQFTCIPTPPCQGKVTGAPCVGYGGIKGICAENSEGDVAWCATEESGGELHAINTDACGNIYVTDDKTGYIWRVSASGEKMELLADTLKAPLTGLVFGNGKGGMEEDTLYVSARGGQEILAVKAGVRGRAVPMPKSAIDKDPQPVNQDFSCAAVRNFQLTKKELDKARGYKDLTFDAEGNLIGAGGDGLWRVSYDNETQLVMANLGYVLGLEYTPDGSIYYSDDSGINRIYPDGSSELIAPNITAFGIISDPQGRLYVPSDSIYRIDPAEKKSEIWLSTDSADMRFNARVITFDPDYSLMFIGTVNGSSGNLYGVKVDNEMNPIGDPFVFATGVGSGSYHDGIAVDVCGNVYVADYPDSLYRVSPDGEDVQEIVHYNSNEYGHGMAFGSGIGGWRSDALYLPQPYDDSTILEIVLGVESPF